MFGKEKLIKYIGVIIISIIFLSVFMFYNISSKQSHKEVFSLNEFTHEENINEGETFETIVENEISPSEKIFVEIKGEVLKPDVYEVNEGDIVKDLIDLAGGLTENGDTSNINQARELQKGECIVIYSKDEIKNLNSYAQNENISMEVSNNSLDLSSSSKDSLININTASKDELKTLNGVGDTLAESIISYREENGNFKTIEDIKNVSRIGDKTFEKFKDKIKV